jgi:hypothetical protein
LRTLSASWMRCPRRSPRRPPPPRPSPHTERLPLQCCCKAARAPASCVSRIGCSSALTGSVSRSSFHNTHSFLYVSEFSADSSFNTSFKTSGVTAPLTDPLPGAPAVLSSQ